MLITKAYHDIPSTLDNGRPMRVYVISPTVPGYPQAKFPGEKVFGISISVVEGRQALWCSGKCSTLISSAIRFVLCSRSEIYQVTGPVERFAGQIASQGYVVGGSIGTTVDKNRVNMVLSLPL